VLQYTGTGVAVYRLLGCRVQAKISNESLENAIGHERRLRCSIQALVLQCTGCCVAGY